MRTDRFFYIPLNCSLYDKDIGYISRKKSSCQFHKSSYRRSSGFTPVQHKCSTWSILIPFFFFFICEVGQLGFQLLLSLFPPRKPKVALLHFEEHVQTYTVEMWSSEPVEFMDGKALARECQLTEPTSFICKIPQYCTYKHWTKWESSFQSAKCYWAFIILCTLYQGKSNFFFWRVY